MAYNNSIQLKKGLQQHFVFGEFKSFILRVLPFGVYGAGSIRDVSQANFPLNACIIVFTLALLRRSDMLHHLLKVDFPLRFAHHFIFLRGTVPQWIYVLAKILKPP